MIFYNVLILNGIDISFHRCYCTTAEPRNTPPNYNFKLWPWYLVNEIGSPTFARFHPHVHSFIMANHYFAFIRKYNIFPIVFNRPSSLFPALCQSLLSINFFYRYFFPLVSPFKPIFM